MTTAALDYKTLSDTVKAAVMAKYNVEGVHVRAYDGERTKKRWVAIYIDYQGIPDVRRPVYSTLQYSLKAGADLASPAVLRGAVTRILNSMDSAYLKPV